MRIIPLYPTTILMISCPNWKYIYLLSEAQAVAEYIPTLNTVAFVHSWFRVFVDFNFNI